MSIAALLVSACAGDKMMQDEMMPFGGPDSVAYAGDLWQALQSARLVGPGAIETKAYPGQHPHGAVLQNVDGMLTVNGVTSPVIVKNNYGGEGVSVENVTRNPSQYLAAVTVMYKRPGYDPDNNDWFWAKYLPDGSLDKNPKGMALAGRVAKVDPPGGCIACHSAAPGGDMVFTHDRFK
ncbi:MAG: cytochrome P460 family protein [Candidatus Competibacteraceae bacterium]|nr:cytochrome P460 family protein [Candidatus Competibacteraceae bacterium]